MQVGKTLAAWFAVMAFAVTLGAAPRKVHVVGLGHSNGFLTQELEIPPGLRRARAI